MNRKQDFISKMVREWLKWFEKIIRNWYSAKARSDNNIPIVPPQ